MILPFLPLLNSKQIILASQSPRRLEILNQIGLKFEVNVSRFPEDLDKTKMTPVEYVQANAREKALEVYYRVTAEQNGVPPALVIGCDTIVEIDGKILGKPKSVEGAIAMLTELSGKSHNVYSGVALICHLNDNAEPLIKIFAEKTQVHMSELSPELIQSYVDTKEPMDKAGSYGIQGIGGCLISGISGCYYNVMGFPLHRFCSELLTILKN